MKFPVTRESLQAFNYDKEQGELREEEIEKKFMQILDQICLLFRPLVISNRYSIKID
jgi:hypothetical protein